MSDRPCPLDGVPLREVEVICAGCGARTRTLLREVPALLVELDTAISRQTSMPPASGVGGCPKGCGHQEDATACVAGVQLVLDTRASDARIALEHVLMGWARVWDEETPLIERSRLLWTPGGQAVLLAAVMLSIQNRQWAGDLAREVRAAVEEGWAAVDRPPDLAVVGRCSECGYALYAPEGVDLVRCRNCGETAVRIDVREASLAESRKLVTIVQLAIAIEVPERTARSWVTRDRLIRVRCDIDGRPLYRVSDGAALKARAEDIEQEDREPA